jgi:prephenate dehydrogenase
MNIAIIGVGLIGGSLAIDLKSRGFATSIIGVDKNINHLNIALQKGIIDKAMPLNQAVDLSDLIILSAPVDINRKLVSELLSLIEDTNKVVVDMGSTKVGIISDANKHRRRKRFVASHPMAGTEYSGPSAAISQLFDYKNCIICDAKDSGEDALNIVKQMYSCLNMNILYMNSSDHDVHTAYISHISHITSFALALCVLEKEKSEEHILNLAAGGFESTVRLAKSNAETWTPIFLQNASYISEVIDIYVDKMRLFQQAMNNKSTNELKEIICKANEIKKIIR